MRAALSLIFASTTNPLDDVCPACSSMQMRAASQSRAPSSPHYCRLLQHRRQRPRQDQHHHVRHHHDRTPRLPGQHPGLHVHRPRHRPASWQRMQQCWDQGQAAGTPPHRPGLAARPAAPAAAQAPTAPAAGGRRARAQTLLKVPARAPARAARRPGAPAPRALSTGRARCPHMEQRAEPCGHDMGCAAQL